MRSVLNEKLDCSRGEQKIECLSQLKTFLNIFKCLQYR